MILFSLLCRKMIGLHVYRGQHEVLHDIYPQQIKVRTASYLVSQYTNVATWIT